MVNINNLISLPVTKENIVHAISQAISHQFIDNLRNRPKTVQFDCKVRGYLGEIALKNWFESNGIFFSDTNIIPDGNDIDIDLSYESNGLIYNIEVKTSLVPDVYKTLQNSLVKCDIKLIKRTARIEDLRGNIHIQIYFDFLRKERDTWLGTKNLNWGNVDNIYDTLELGRYMGSTYFCGWVDKPTLIQNINNLPTNQRTWTFPYAQKDFWKCNIQESAKIPIDIIKYIRSLNN